MASYRKFTVNIGESIDSFISQKNNYRKSTIETEGVYKQETS